MLPENTRIVLFQDNFITDTSLRFQDKCLIFMPWVSEGNSATGRCYWKGQGMNPSAGRGVWISGAEGSQHRAGAETRWPSGEEPSLRQREMDTFAFSFLLWFLPSELSVFLMLSTVLQRRNGSQGLKECYPGHHFNSVIWDSSIPLTWLNYQTKDLVTPYTQDGQVQETSWQREQVYWRNDAIPSSHKTKIRKDI